MVDLASAPAQQTQEAATEHVGDPSRNPWARWFRRFLWLGIVQDAALGIPATFAPQRTLRFVRQRRTGDETWTGFAALIVTLLGMLYIPAAINPYRYRMTAILAAAARPPGVVYFFKLRPRTYPIFGIIDAVLCLLQIPTLIMALRTEHRRYGSDGVPGQATAPGKPPTAASGRRKEIEREALFAYDGITFDELKAACWEGPYGDDLPHYRGLSPTNPRQFLRLMRDGSRNLVDRRDLLPWFDKLIHPNGITLTGVWRIDTENPYTGWFANGSEGLVLGRGSVAANAIMAGQRRAFGWGLKVFPTMDPTEKVQPGNIVAVSVMAGEKHQHIVDFEPTNMPPLGPDPRPAFVNRIMFGLMDTRPGWRQVWPVSTLGVPEDGEVRTPDLIKIVVAEGTPRADKRDFRDELRLENYPDGKLEFDLLVRDFPDADWTRIGSIVWDDYAIAEGGDKRLQFWIPRDVPSAPGPV